MNATDAFLKFDYGETKDLLETFLTLISATLVFSITFSEKIVGIKDAKIGTKYTLVFSWVMLILALVFAGISMCFIAAAAGKIIYGIIPLFNSGAGSLALTSWFFILLSGASYVAGLIAMAVAGARGMSLLSN